MNKQNRFFRDKCFAPRLRQLLVLFAFVLMSMGAWATDYNLWIGDKQVTDANKTDVLGDGTVVFSVGGDAAAIYTLTLKGATLTAPIKIGLSNLTIDIQGTNKITTSETCIQKMDNTTPSVTFKSTSTEVGSLSLKGTSGVNNVGEYGVGSFSISDQFAVIMKYSDRYYSNQYYFTDGSTTEALLTPSYGITVGGMQIGEGNADNVTGNGIGDGSVTPGGTVSFDKKTNTLTLNKATIGVGYINDYPITSSLPNLNIKLIGDNTATVDANYPSCVYYNGTVGATSPKLTFIPSDREVTESNGVLSVGFGSLTVNRISEIGSLSNGYDFEAPATGITPDNAGESCWDAQIGAQSLTLSYVEAYNVWYGNNRVISTDLIAGVSGAPYFNPETNTILLNQPFNNGPIKSQLDELTVQVNGNVSLESAYAAPAIQYTGKNDGKLTFTCASSATPTSLTLDANNTGGAAEYKAIEGFSSNNITFTSPMKLASPSSSELLTATTVKVANYDSYGLTVAGTPVTSLNKDNILKGTANDGKVSYSDGTLTLNGASIGAVYSENSLTIHLLGANILDAGGEKAIYTTNSNKTLTFTTDESAPGQLLIINVGNKTLQASIIGGFTVDYANGLSYNIENGAMAIATLPSMSPESGVYWPTQKITITDGAGYMRFDQYNPQSEPFTLAVGTHDYLYAYKEVTNEETKTTVRLLSDRSYSYYIHNKPGFSVASGTYEETQNIKITNLPNDLPTGDDVYPQVWYYLGDDDGDDTNDVRITSADQTIEVSESTKVSVYIVEVDSGNKKKSEVVEAEYVIRRNLATSYTVTVDATQTYTYTGEAIEPAVTVTPKGGGTALVQNTDYTVSYSNNVNAATANAATAPTVTVTGMGNYTGVNSVTFTINAKTLTAAMVTLSSESFEYNGATQKPEVTVADGTTLTANDYTIVNDGGMEGGTYNVVVTGKNNYTGEVTKTFEIVKHVLDLDTDVQFADNQDYATYYNEAYDIYLPNGVVAYIVTEVDGTSVTTQRISYIPKGVPVLLEKGTSTETPDDQMTGNMLHGTTTQTEAANISGGTVYVLYNGEFVRCTEGVIPAGRCYLLVPDGSNARRLTIGHGDNATGIKTAVGSLESEQWYDMQGRSINKPTKPGFYILKGKKVAVRK